MMGAIYAVHDIGGLVVYVGKTEGPVEDRFFGHVTMARAGGGTPFLDWLAEQVAAGVLPRVSTLQRCQTVAALDRAERHWVAAYASPRLLNVRLLPRHAEPKPEPTGRAQRRRRVVTCSRCKHRFTGTRPICRGCVKAVAKAFTVQRRNARL